MVCGDLFAVGIEHGRVNERYVRGHGIDDDVCSFRKFQFEEVRVVDRVNGSSVRGTKVQRFRRFDGAPRVNNCLCIEGVVSRFTAKAHGDYIVDSRLDHAPYAEAPYAVGKETVVAEFYQIPGAVVQTAKGIELAERVYPQVGRSRGVGQVDFEDVAVVTGVDARVDGCAQLHKRGSVIIVAVVVFDGLPPGATRIEDEKGGNGGREEERPQSRDH